MTKSIVKQINKETYLDLTQCDLTQSDFINEFNTLTKDKVKFFDGSSISLLLPEGSDLKDEQINNIVQEIRNVLNKQNIALSRALNKAPSSIEQKLDVDEGAVQEPVTQNPDAQFLPDTLYIKANMRAGQFVQHPGNVIVYGDVNHSAEIIASGDVMIWGRLSGVVHAGAEGDDNAVIAALKISTGQLRISDKFVSLAKEDKPANKAAFVPEIAKIVDNEVQIEKVTL